MADVPYLVGGESPTIARMNALFGSLDAKLASMMGGIGGRSFFLAQAEALPQKLCGKAFFFTSGVALYSRRVPGYIETGIGGTNFVARPYDHSVFTAAVAAIDWTTATTDTTLKIVTITAFASSLYTAAGLPALAYGVNFLDWSLAAHTLAPIVVDTLAIGAAGTGYVVGNTLTFAGGTGGPATIKVTAVGGSGEITGVQLVSGGCYSAAPATTNSVTGGSGSGATVLATYTTMTCFIQEAGGVTPPEKRYKHALAEIVIEGVTSVDLPADCDKYSCFRIHNLQRVGATVNFAGGSHAVTLGPFQCVTVRRDSATTNYRAGLNYFFTYEGGDPRFYWFLPKSFSGTTETVSDSGNAVTNSCAANNLTNPAILLDWVGYFTREMDKVSDYDYPVAWTNGWYAGWAQDPSVQADVSSFYAGKFGDPNDPATTLGDLLHHKGDILIVRSSKTATDPITGSPLLTFDTVTFNGYASIVADFALHLLSVAADGSGNYVITNTDSANNVYLLPISTNLLKTGDVVPTIVSLVGFNSFTIESAVFENPDYSALTATPAQTIFQPTTTSTPDSRDYKVGYWDGVSEVATVTGSPIIKLDWSHGRSTSLTVNGIHTVTVADLLSLDFWGDPAVSGQSSTYVTIADQKLTLTPEGLVITWTETDADTPPPVADAGVAYYRWLTLRQGIPIKKIIRLRGHGWGYYSTANGSRDTGWLSCRTPWRQIGTVYKDEVSGVDGVDFSLGSVANTATELSIHGRVKTTRLGLSSKAGRFWRCRNPINYMIQFLGSKATQTEMAFGSLFAISTVSATNAGIAPDLTGTFDGIAMMLLPEMYNGLARSVNSVTSATPLRWQTMRFSLFGQYVSFDKYYSVENDAFAGISYYPKRYSFSDRGAWDADANSPELGSGIGIPGDYYEVTTAGTTALDGVASWSVGDYVVFTVSGAWVKRTTADWPPFAGSVIDYGIVPMEHFENFAPNSQFEALCNQLGVPIKTESDLPGGTTPTGAQSFEAFKNMVEAKAAWFNTINGSVSDCAVSGSTSLTVTATIHLSLTTEVLSTANLLNGLATGSFCAGTWDGASMPSGLTQDGLGIHSSVDRPKGTYWVCNATNFYISQIQVTTNAGSGYSVDDILTVPGTGTAGTLRVAAVNASGRITAMAIQAGGSYSALPAIIVSPTGGTGSGAQFALLYSLGGAALGSGDVPPRGVLMIVKSSSYNSGTGVYDLEIEYANPVSGWLMGTARGHMADVNLRTAYIDFRWISVSDVLAALESFGLGFSHLEMSVPLSLRYFSDPYLAEMQGASGTDAYSVAGIVNDPPVTSGEISDYIAAQNAKTSFGYGVPPVTFPYAGIAYPGAEIRFCMEEDASSANWKKVGWTPPLGGADIDLIQQNPVILDCRPGISISPLFQPFGGEGHFNIDPAARLTAAGNSDFAINLSLLNSQPSASTRPVAARLLGANTSAWRKYLRILPEGQEGNIPDQFFAVAVNNTYSSSLSAYAIPIRLSAQPFWMRTVDSWVNADDMVGITTLIGLDALPWTQVAAGTSVSVAIGAGLNIVSAPTVNESYKLLYGVVSPKIVLP